jgi:hypothetical protein
MLYYYSENISEYFLFCESLEGRMTIDEFFGLINKFLKKNGLSWSIYVALCSDGEVALAGVKDSKLG